MENTSENYKKWTETLHERNRVLNELLQLTQIENEELKKQLNIHSASKRYFLFECTNADKQKLKKLITAPDRKTAIANIETNYPYIEKWHSSEELNVC